jgi:hypothetical protein
VQAATGDDGGKSDQGSGLIPADCSSLTACPAVSCDDASVIAFVPASFARLASQAGGGPGSLPLPEVGSERSSTWVSASRRCEGDIAESFPAVNGAFHRARPQRSPVGGCLHLARDPKRRSELRFRRRRYDDRSSVTKWRFAAPGDGDTHRYRRHRPDQPRSHPTILPPSDQAHGSARLIAIDRRSGATLLRPVPRADDGPCQFAGTGMPALCPAAGLPSLALAALVSPN